MNLCYISRIINSYNWPCVPADIKLNKKIKTAAANQQTTLTEKVLYEEKNDQPKRKKSQIYFGMITLRIRKKIVFVLDGQQV